MKISLYQFCVAGIAVYIIVRRSIMFFRRIQNQSFLKFISVLMIWGGIAVFALWPSLAREITYALGMGENLNTIIFIAFIVLFTLVFRLLTLIERLESDITSIIRKDALSTLLPTKLRKGTQDEK